MNEKEQPTTPYFATTPRGMEGLLAAELSALGIEQVRESRAGVHFGGTLRDAYLACLHSRLASRVLLILSRCEIESSEDLFAAASAIDWPTHMYLDKTFAVDAVANGSPLRDGRYAALLVKDAIADSMRAAHNARPDVDKTNPDLRINVTLIGKRAILALDLAGESLHRRGYRSQTGPAPIKENLAFALALRSGWKPTEPGILADPFCGSGTILIEAAQAASGMAPARSRQNFGFRAWRGHNEGLWQSLRAEAKAAERTIAEIRFTGFDRDPRAIAIAKDAARAAGVAEAIRFEVSDAGDASPEPGTRFVATNPPYGKRLGNQAELIRTYADLGAFLKRASEPLRALVLTAAPETLPQLRLKADRKFTLYNGAVACVAALYTVHTRRLQPEQELVAAPEVDDTDADNASTLESEATGPQADGEQTPSVEAPNERTTEQTDGGRVNVWKRASAGTPPTPPQTEQRRSDAITLSHAAQEFRNRLTKNAKRITRWAKRENLEAYRVYDADLPAYNVAIDIYAKYVLVQEYRAPADVDQDKAAGRMQDVLLIVPEVLGIPPRNVILRQRRRMRGKEQYEKLASTGELLRVREYEARFLVNLYDYLDTGLFPDHRLVRREIGLRAEGKRFLNLFGYTGTASVSAGLGGALRTTTVDLSKNYLEWAERNFRENSLPLRRHDLVAMDCSDFLAETRDTYDLIFLNPPVFSTSKKMRGTLDLERDHATLIREAADTLADDGELIFSTNLRNFSLDENLLTDFVIKNLSKSTLPLDFERSAKEHHVWLIKKS